MNTVNADPDAAAAPFATLGCANAFARRKASTLAGWHALRILLKLGFLAGAAVTIGHLVMSQPVATWLPFAALAALALSTAAGFVADTFQARAELAVSTSIRSAIATHLRGLRAIDLEAIDPGKLTVSLQRYPQAVAALVIGHRAARTMMAAGPLMAAAALLFVSWQAALMVLGLTPVMIIFFALIGDKIRRWADAQERSFGRLAGQFADRIRTLPTILANDALPAEEAKLHNRLSDYAASTMRVLRVAFLNAGIIDFFASLSIAMLAVFLGLGHLKLAMIPGFSDLELWQSLFILMIAPDYFAPFRRYAEQYHAKAEGESAAFALDALLNVPHHAAPPLPQWLDTAEPLPERGLVALVGPSGTGKTTLLRRFAGVDTATPPQGHGVAWASTGSFIPGGSLATALNWNEHAQADTGLHDAASRTGLLDEDFLPGGLSAEILTGGANLSGGQRLRVAIARAIASVRPIFADEPTAKIDADTAARIRKALKEASETRLVVAATHDPTLAALADRVIDLTPEEITV